MKAKTTVIRSPIIKLSLAFLFIFFGYGGIQQYVTTYFDSLGLKQVGYNSLILVYLFFFLTGPISAIFVSKKGPKLAMIIATFSYSLYIFSLVSAQEVVIYLTSALIGCSAALLWTGQNVYLVRSSPKENLGANAGIFSASLHLGEVLGIIFAGFLAKRISFSGSFSILGFAPLIGILLLALLKDYHVDQIAVAPSRFVLLKKALISKTAIRVSVIFTAQMFIFGLVIGVIPIEINRIWGMTYVAGLSSIFFIAPVLFSYFLGKTSDMRGRKFILVTSFVTSIVGLSFLYLSSDPWFFLLGVILLAITFAGMSPASAAIIGDITTEQNIEYVTALSYMMRNLGVVTALALSGYLPVRSSYLASIIMLLVTAGLFLPLLHLEMDEIKKRIQMEINS